MKLSIVLFDAFTMLDAIGGYEVLARLPGVEVEFVATDAGVVAADTRRAGLVAFRALADVVETDILYVPGGPGTSGLEEDETFLSALRRLDETSSWTVGICNGVGLLAAAGLLEGASATTNYFFREQLAARGVEVVTERYHRAGKYVTGAGVSASIDAALFLAGEIAGEAVAKAIALGIEYFPSPPHPERSPEDMPRPIVEMVRAYQTIFRPKTLASTPPFAAAGPEERGEGLRVPDNA